MSKRHYIRYAVTSAFFHATSATAGSYSFSDIPENAEAPKIAVCRDFMENLQRLGNPPMVCDRRFDKTLTQFSWPQWKSIDPVQHRDLVEQIWRQWYGEKNRQSSGYQKAYVGRLASFEESTRKGDITLAVTQVLINGVLREVIRFGEDEHSRPCKPNGWSSTFVRQHYIVDHELKNIDFVATAESALNGYYSYVNDMRPDLFLYNGKPYVAAWYENGINRGHIEVFGNYENYCFINYTPIKKERTR